MVNIVYRLLGVLFVAVCTSAVAIEIPSEYQDAVANSQRVGRALFEAKESSFVNKQTMTEFKRKGVVPCDYAYKKIHINDKGQDLYYLVGHTKRETDIVVGRHFLLKDEEAIPSTNDCFNVGTPKRGVLWATVTHLLSVVVK